MVQWFARAVSDMGCDVYTFPVNSGDGVHPLKCEASDEEKLVAQKQEKEQARTEQQQAAITGAKTSEPSERLEALSNGQSAANASVADRSVAKLEREASTFYVPAIAMKAAEALQQGLKAFSRKRTVASLFERAANMANLQRQKTRLNKQGLKQAIVSFNLLEKVTPILRATALFGCFFNACLGACHYACALLAGFYAR